MDDGLRRFKRNEREVAVVQPAAISAVGIDVGIARFATMSDGTYIARDCGIDRQTVQGYYQILVDTLIGYYLYPYHKKIKRDLITLTPKFYLFDVGVANYLAKQNIIALQGSAAGKSFEHYIFMELTAYIGLNKKRVDITYWRTKTGLEADFILGKGDIAIEVKLSQHVHQEDLKGLIAFCEEHPHAHAHAHAIVISQDSLARLLKVTTNLTISILPWKVFLQRLWKGEIV